MADLGALIDQLNGAIPGPVTNQPSSSAFDPLIQQLTAAVAAPSSEKSPPPPEAQVHAGAPSLLTNFLYGARQPIDAAAMMLGKAFPSQAESVAVANKQAEEAFKSQNAFPGSAGKVAELMGNVATTAPIAAAIPGAASASLLARLGSGAAGGAVSGALTPVDPNDPNYWGQVGKNAAFGSLGGAAAPLVLGGAARIVNPDAVSRIASLTEKGVTPTIGQTLGGAAGRAEEALSSWPVTGDLIRSGRMRALEQFDRGAINDVLAPIGETLETKNMGRDALLEMSDKVSKAWRSAVPETAGQLDPQLMNEIANLRQMAGATPRATQFDNVLRGQIFNNVSPNGTMSGEAFKNADSALGQIVRDTVYGHGVPWEDRQFGGGVRELQASMRDWLARANPQASEDLGNARAASLRMLPIERAANAQGGEPGTFSAAQLLAGVKKYTPDKQFMLGQGVGQPYAEAGKAVLGSKVPDSGTPGRALLAMLGGTAGSALLGHEFAPETLGYLMAGGLGAGTAAGLYSPLGQRLASTLLSSRPSSAPAIAQRVRNFSPLASALVPWINSPTP